MMDSLIVIICFNVNNQYLSYLNYIYIGNIHLISRAQKDIPYIHRHCILHISKDAQLTTISQSLSTTQRLDQPVALEEQGNFNFLSQTTQIHTDK